MLVNRKELLRSLLLVESGLSRRSHTVAQSDCFVLRRGRLYTLSDEVACSLPSGLPAEWEAAVPAEKLLPLLKSLPDDELEMNLTAKSLTLTGRGRSRLVLEAEVVQESDQVVPGKDWRPLPPDFGEAVEVARSCTKKDDDEFARQCVHVCPGWLEASDDRKLVRYEIETPVAADTLVRGTTLRAAGQLGFTKMTESNGWLHLKNGVGLRVSLRKHEVTGYPDFSEVLALRGDPVQLPPALTGAIDRASLFCRDDGCVLFELSRGLLRVTGRCQEGEHSEEVKVRWVGPDTAFWAPAALAEPVADNPEWEVAPGALRMDGGKFRLLTRLEV